LSKIIMSTDAELLHRFVADRSESAFTELVHRHLTLVHATALRRVGRDAHAADDVTQQVFVSLARKASSLRGHATLAGWLYVCTHHATAEWVRREQRRKQREATAHSMHLNDSSAESQDDTRLRPLLDDALVTLKPDEREALVLRFFSGRSFAEIGNAVQSSEEAARKRVDRALEKLHAVLVRRGVTSTVAALGTALTAASLDSAPAGLALKVAGVALTKAAAPSVMASLASAL
jgi:RNA polymerase sigma factor (sigma-70 family)